MNIAPVGEKAEGFLQHEVSPVYIFRGKAIAFRFCKTKETVRLPDCPSMARLP